MSVPATIQRRIVIGGISYGNNYTRTVGSPHLYEEVIINTAVNKEILMPFDLSQCEVGMILATTALTIKTNDTITPTQTIVLQSNEAIVWDVLNFELTCPFTSDITKIYVSNSSGSDSTLQIMFAFDATP